MALMITIFFFFFLLVPLFYHSVAVDTLVPNQSLLDNGETLVSSSQTFVLGFFSPWSSKNRYVGIWFKNVPQQTVIWVANNNNPILNSSGVLRVTANGDVTIGIINQTEQIWSSNSSSGSMIISSPILQLLDNGNLVVRNGNSDNYLWQSFDYPRDSLIPGMKLGWNLRTRKEWYITSWKSLEDPASGDSSYTYRLDIRGLPTLVLRQGSNIQYRSGPWDGLHFGRYAISRLDSQVVEPIMVYDDENVYYTYKNGDASVISRFVVNHTGMIKLYTWSQDQTRWIDIATIQSDTCDTYKYCGSNSVCNINEQQLCQCLDGFEPRQPRDWGMSQWGDGCARKVALNCSKPQGFMKVSGMKLPEDSHVLGNTSIGDCKTSCLRSCSCMAYASTTANGCVVWYGDLLDMRVYYEDGQDLYVRMLASELTDLGGSSNKGKRTAVIASVSGICGLFLLALISWYGFHARSSRRRGGKELKGENQDNNQNIGEEELELPLFDFNIISNATSDFSFANKIGEGGFGPVYKGVLATGQEIAVKRQAKDSGQGLTEFKNEVILIAKLQHRNLVRLLGCCILRDEKLLVYEYMPNKSLDMFIFDQTKRGMLDWRKRFNIIEGIARGLLYLHRDSRLRIIHRDLKASNILLDNEMNPKISDFGLARTFGGGDQHQESTKRIMGTYGYMSPEYAMNGLFSVKSDVFSFGVLVLEIISGQKNRGFHHPDHDLSLLGHVWKLWNEGKAMEVVDPCMKNPNPAEEILKCINVGLVCVQERPEDRPTMSTTLFMLESENPVLPNPKQPGFHSETHAVHTHSSSTGKMSHISNDATITLLHGR